MKPLCLLLLTAAAAVAQPISFGVKGGLPLTDFLNTGPNNIRFGSDSTTNRYIIGPSIELRLPHGFGIELDALYRHFSYTYYYSPLGPGDIDARTRSGAWEFPLVAKYKFGSGWVRPYVEAGVSWDRVSGLTQALTTFPAPGTINHVSTSSPSELNNKTTTGFVTGAGVDIKALLIHISPEIRFTRWGAKHFISTDLLNSNQNQAEFLVGFKF